MDDSLLAELQSFSVGTVVNDTKAPHPHYALYKQKREGYGDQEARRKKLLREQKLRREDYADYVRRIVDKETWEEMEQEEEGGFDEVDKGDSKEDGMQVCIISCRVDIIRLTHANIWESMGKPYSCTQFIKSHIFYYKSRENPYQCCKSRKNPYQVL